jgi:phosphate starvation-inducible PhoH-like protein
LELTISLPHGDERLAMTGSAERNLKIIRESLGVNISARDDSLKISGDSQAVGRAAQVLEQLGDAARRQRPMDRQQLLEAIASVNQSRGRNSRSVVFDTRGQDGDGERRPPRRAPRGEGYEGGASRESGSSGGMEVYLRSKQVRAMTPGQQRYIEAIHDHDLTFCIGPAGTGKTYLAVAAAANMLRRGDVRKLVLVRPAVEAGEKLGFLPGDMQAKVNPYLRPLLDALHDMMDYEQIQRFMATDLIEIIPLAFMRGRTLNEALVILDEAQNTTKGQMLMFLTRLGHGSKMIVTGDTSQIDLEDPRESGLIDAARRLMRVPGIGFVTLEQTDIVRHSLVQRIVEAYNPNPTPPRGRRGRGPENQPETADGDAAGK